MLQIEKIGLKMVFSQILTHFRTETSGKAASNKKLNTILDKLNVITNSKSYIPLEQLYQSNQATEYLYQIYEQSVNNLHKKDKRLKAYLNFKE
jgi:hypothetical protein